MALGGCRFADRDGAEGSGCPGKCEPGMITIKRGLAGFLRQIFQRKLPVANSPAITAPAPGFNSERRSVFIFDEHHVFRRAWAMPAIPLTSTSTVSNQLRCTDLATKLSEHFMASLYTFGGGKKSVVGAAEGPEIMNHQGHEDHQGADFVRVPGVLWCPLAGEPERHARFRIAYGEEDLLDQLHCAGAGGGFRPAYLVGAGSHDSHRLCELVDRLSQ